MSTYAIVAKGADALLYCATDASVPTGHFLALAIVSGMRRTYLLQGTMFDPAAQVIGRIDQTPYGLLAYRWHGILGGHPLPVEVRSEAHGIECILT